MAFALLPRSKGSVPPPPKSTPGADSEAMTRAKRRRLAKAKSKQTAGATGKPSAPSNTSKGNGGKGIDIPSGAKTRDDQGRPICFRYNRKACDQSKDKCQRGYHVCWFCLKSHPGASRLASSLGHPAPRLLLLDRCNFLRQVILLQICTALRYLQTLSAPRLRWGSSGLFLMCCLPKILHVAN